MPSFHKLIKAIELLGYFLPSQAKLSIPLILAMTLVSCKHNTTNSDLKHDYGAISEVPHMLDCKQKEQSPEFKLITDYLGDLSNNLIKANQSHLAPEFHDSKFCFSIINSTAVNASASYSGEIRFSIGLFAMAENDAQVATILAHEMAHVFSGHQGGRIHPDMKNVDTYKKLLGMLESMMTATAAAGNAFNKEMHKHSDVLIDIPKAQEFLHAFLEFDELLVDPSELKSFDLKRDILIPARSHKPVETNFIPSKKDSLASLIPFGINVYAKVLSLPEDLKSRYLEIEQPLMDAYQDLLTKKWAEKDHDRKIAALELKHLGKEIAANWREQEADEVGLEMYLRAGFDVDEWTNTFEMVRSHRLKTIQSIPDLSPEQLESMIHQLESCERGYETHPTLCWRGENIRGELKKHKHDYAHLVPNAKIKDLPKSVLPKIREMVMKVMP